ncbi:MAG: adenylate/guanylate cyclase domain-containing protein [Cyclobacteriaceae bacterium]
MKNRYFRYILRHFVIWNIAFIFWGLMREFGQEVVQDFDPITFSQRLRLHLVIGIVSGLLFGSLDYFIERKVFKHVSLGKAMLIGLTSFTVVVLLLLTFAMRAFTRIAGLEFNWDTYSDFMFSNEMLLLVFYFFLIAFLADIFKQIDKKLGPGNLWRMIIGKFYQPKEDERIFMFLDLKSSTSIAEKIGHIKYSKLIQDCFKDLHVVEKYHAEVYQYVGDEVVLTWSREIGLADSNCLRAFFEFRKKLVDKADYYMKKYGVIPEFKAGLNIGKIVVAEVGEIKTEIAYHGDTINTAARIQEQCNILKRSLLISEKLKTSLMLDSGFASDHVGDILLKGKSSKVNIYSVDVSRAYS